VQEYSDIKNLYGLIHYSVGKGCTYFTTHREKCKTHILKSYFTKRNDIFFMIVEEMLPYPKHLIYSVLSCNETGQVEVINNFLTLQEAKTEYFKHIANEPRKSIHRSKDT
jgi:hypothetical protein